MKLVAEWKSFWKMISVWIFAVIGVIPQAMVVLTPALTSQLPQWFLNALSIAAFLGIVGRLVQQQSITK